MQIVEAVALISINETMVFQLISFLIFLWIFNRIMIQPLRSVTKDRQSYIQGIEADVTDAQEQVEGLALKIKEQERDARKAAQAIRIELEEAGSREAADALSQARQEVARIRRQAQESLLQRMLDERKNIDTEAETLCLALMEKILNRRLTT